MAVARRKLHLGPAECFPTDSVGDLVYIRDAMSSIYYRVTKADPSSSLKMPAVGIIVQKASSTICTVQFYNAIRGIYPSLDPGFAYVVGTDGRPAKPGDPNYPGSGFLVQQVGVATDDGELFLSPMDIGSGGGGAGGRYFQQPLITTLDPKVFMTPIPFKHGGLNPEVLEYNGQRLKEGIGQDYIASESGGVGTGYDTITLEFIPATDSNWLIDYVPDL